MRGDGDGWQVCAAGHRHWGRYGAAGLFLHSGGRVLLQHRAEWSHFGGTWGLLGGARDSQETPEGAALREAAEEGNVSAAAVRPTARYVDDHGTWSYTTVVARQAGTIAAQATGREGIEVRWVPFEEVPGLPLHPGFAAAWPALRDCLRRLVVVVDAANVVGSRPDGWWRDRAGATVRLRDRLTALADGIPGSTLPALAPSSGLDRWFPRTLLVVEGQARGVPGVESVDAIPAPGSGDDEIAALAARHGGDEADAVLVVTADRELRRRCERAGASVVGPGWLHRLLDRPVGKVP